jgi:hypothetical protein
MCRAVCHNAVILYGYGNWFLAVSKKRERRRKAKGEKEGQRERT